MKKSIDLSIIVISYNTKAITHQCIESIYQSVGNGLKPFTTKMAYEIIVIDNESTDGSVEMLNAYKRKRPDFIFIKNHKNFGFARANNQGVKIARGNYLLFLNSDIIVLKDALVNIYNYLRQNESRINFLGGKLLNKDRSPQPSCGHFYSLPVIFAALFLRGDYWGFTRFSPNQLKEVDWISGACILTKKTYFEKIGGFDEKIFMYMDEIDLLYRAKKTGFRVFFYPDAKFIHLGSASSAGKTYPIIQVYKGLIYFYKKHHSALQLFFLKLMLKLKALAGIALGILFNNEYLKETYSKAYLMVKMA